ncbi:hypothetical protein EVAR_17999_1 [Eumeta japonica]|uniref:Uncharacterized protein n=1 Tax=Eumeta variegata TaxID=151549 RepID=A0A4C1Y5N6_EUMVA|nr:hypothetical protein EVAR_17999_1 [Eumeta japonica]
MVHRDAMVHSRIHNFASQPIIHNYKVYHAFVFSSPPEKFTFMPFNVKTKSPLFPTDDLAGAPAAARGPRSANTHLHMNNNPTYAAPPPASLAQVARRRTTASYVVFSSKMGDYEEKS